MRNDIRLYLTGDPGTVRYGDDDVALGGVASQAELHSNFAIIEGAISSLGVEYVSQRNSTGVGTITAYANNQFAYTAPGDTEGALVTVAYGDTKTLLSNNNDAYVRVTRDIDNTEQEGATLSLRVCPVYGNAVGMSEVAQAGSTEYRALILYNGSNQDMTGITVYGDTGLEVGYEALTTGAIQTIADAETAPSGVTFNSSVIPPDVTAGESVGIWLKRTVAASATVESLFYELNIAFDWGATLAQNLYYGGSTRVYDALLEGYELYIGDDTQPNFSAAPTETSATLPFSTALTPPGAGDKTYYAATRYRNKYNLVSLNIYAEPVRIDDDGAVVSDDLSAPYDITLSQGTSGEIDITATYDPNQGTYKADTWYIFISTDGTDPDPNTDTPIEVSVQFGSVVAQSVFPVIGAPSSVRHLNYSTDAYRMGTDVRVVVQMHDSTNTVSSEASSVAQITVNTGTAPSPQLHNAFGGRRWAYVRWYNREVYGAGTVADPWLVWNINDLQAIGSNTGVYTGWTRAAHYRQMQDIDAGSTRYWNSEAGFVPIGGTSSPYFSGVYDGNGFSIYDLFIDRSATNMVGLFSRVTGSVQAARLVDCDITGQNLTGAICGSNEGATVLQYCCSTGSIVGNEQVGGLSGRNWGSTAKNNYSACTVNGSRYIAGLYGSNGNGHITNCYSIGPATGTQNVGGLTGFENASSSVTSSYWDTTASGNATSAGGTGKTTAEMQQEATFADWDFDHIWTIDEGNDYPRLRISR